MSNERMMRAITVINPLVAMVIALGAAYSFTDIRQDKDCYLTWIEIKGGVEVGQYDNPSQDYVNQSLMGGGIFVRGCRNEKNAKLAD